MRHIISILLQNEAGALARVSGMFSARGYNIESLTVAPTHDDAMSRLTLVTTGSDPVIEQIVQQTRKLIDVVEVSDLSGRDHLEVELLLIKLEVSPQSAPQVVELLRRHRGMVIDERDNTRTVQLTAPGPEVNEFLNEVKEMASILEVVRSGVAAIEPGHAVLAAGVLSPP